MIQGVKPVGAAERGKAGGRESAAENLRHGFANPLQAGLAGLVVEGKHQKDAPAVRSLAASLGIAVRGARKCARADKDHGYNQMENPEGHNELARMITV